MTDQEINQAIAEACGWTRAYIKDLCGEFEHKFWNPPVPVSLTLPNEWNGGKVREQNLPDYCHDLNAMHEAEKCFDAQSQWEEYEAYLNTQVHSFFLNIHLIHATARQRAEAFLRTLGKWREQC